jgi:CPA2 family monovalent cation:H+ antiporter-2
MLAGVVVGPFTPGFVADIELAPQLAEIGVMLLMFGVGMHCSPADLLAVRRVAIPGALGQMAAATVMGALLSHYWGWSLTAGLLFGLSLSVASTVVVLRALQANGLQDTEAGRIAVGWLIVEDLVMVLLLVMLPALLQTSSQTVGADTLWMTLAVTLGKVAAFVAVMMVLGRKFFPWLLGWASRTGESELFTLAVLSLSVGVAFGAAELFGVSFALGAFFAGLMVGGSQHEDRVAAEVRPAQDMFGVLFFVSVGMLLDPMVLIRQPLHVLAVVGVIVVGKTVVAYLIVLALGYPKATARSIGASLAQIGEFSFILAGLGLALKVFPQEASDLLLAGAVMSIVINPLLFHLMNRQQPTSGQ